MISDLWMPNTKTWNIPLLTTLFGAQNANLVENIPISKDNGDDFLIWKYTSSWIESINNTTIEIHST
jgi:hypothetical protein